MKDDAGGNGVVVGGWVVVKGRGYAVEEWVDSESDCHSRNERSIVGVR